MKKQIEVLWLALFILTLNVVVFFDDIVVFGVNVVVVVVGVDVVVVGVDIVVGGVDVVVVVGVDVCVIDGNNSGKKSIRAAMSTIIIEASITSNCTVENLKMALALLFLRGFGGSGWVWGGPRT
jgi:hypothetical protein